MKTTEWVITLVAAAFVAVAIGVFLGATICQRVLLPLKLNPTTVVYHYIAPTPMPFPYVQNICAKQDDTTEKMLLHAIHHKLKG